MAINYIIDYKVYDAGNKVIKEGKIKVKNKPSKFIALVSTEAYFKKHVVNFSRFEVIGCTEDYTSVLEDFFNSPIFKTKK